MGLLMDLENWTRKDSHLFLQTEKPGVRRACHLRKGRPTVVDLGCELPDGKIIPVGSKAEFKVPASEGKMVTLSFAFLKKIAVLITLISLLSM